MTRVAVVGAGFAGLAAAVTLADAGVDVVVYEARERVGGRVWSEPLDGPDGTGPIIERGAEFVLTGYDEMRRWLDRVGLSLVETGMSYYVREPRWAHGMTVDPSPSVSGPASSWSTAPGGPVATDSAPVAPVSVDDMRLTAAALARLPHEPGVSVADLLDRLDVRPEVAEAVRARIEVSCAWNAADLAASVVSHVASFESAPSHRVDGGNQGLAIRMAELLGDKVRTGVPVTKVEHSPGGVLLTSTSGLELYDAVVLTVPLPLLRDLEIVPPLPLARRDALERMTIGHAAKAHIGVRGALATSAVLSVPDRFWCWTATGADGQVLPVLNAFAGSPAAVAALRTDEGSSVWVSRLVDIRDDLDLDQTTAVVTTWHDDPWARGAYSADGLSGQPGDGAVVAQPLGRLFVAGEHTAGEWSGLMEGALRSGTRAAGQVLDAVGATGA
jgi:monoamine oxidase